MNNQERIKILQDLIRINSVNGNEKKVALYIQQLLKQHNINSQLVDYSINRSNLIAEIGMDNNKILGYTGHMDVVDPGDLNLWTHDPFVAYIDGNKLYGRGSTDMKSGLAAMVIAMIELKESHTPLKGKIRLLATVGEEIGELGAAQLTELGYADDLTGLIIGEPSNYNLIYTHMGSINYTVTSIGKEAHSSMPELGNNAINRLLPFMNQINQKMEKVAHDYEDKNLGRTIHNITVINGGNQVNSIPNKAVIQGNIRSIPKFGNNEIINILKSTINEVNKLENTNLKLTIDYNKKPVYSSKDSTLIKTIQQVYQQKTGSRMPLLGIAGTTDAAEFTASKNTFEFVIFGPGVATLPHQINEYVEITNYLDMIDNYKLIAKQYLQ